MITPIQRPSFVSVVEPRDFDDGKPPKYSLCVAVPKTEKTFLRELNAAVEATAKEKWGKIPPKMASVIRDGDEENVDGDRPEFEGCVVFNMSSKRKPGIVIKNPEDEEHGGLTPLDDFLFSSGKSAEQVIYSGMECRVSFNLFAYEFKGKKGISASINNLMKTGDNDPYSGGASAEADFSEYV